MSQNPVQWIIRLEAGNLKGPIDTAVVLKMIREGAFTGSELIARYPDGQWTFISREPEFYDVLMEALEGAIRTDNRKVQKNMTEETIFMPAPPPPDLLQRTGNFPQVQTPLPQAMETPTSGAFEEQKGEGTLELHSVTKIKKKQLFKVSRGPLMLLGGAFLLLVGFFIFSGGDGSADKISLIAPGKPGAPLPEAEAKKRYRTVLNHIEKDTFEDYLEAQNKMVALIEGAPSDLEMRSVLCLIYKELWPYAKQDAADIKTVSNFSQSTRVLDVTSPYGSFCEAVKLYTSGRYRESRGAVENLLESYDNFSMRPVAYEFKAELLENDKDYQIAVRYYEKAAQDWDHWLKPKVRAGFVYLQLHVYPTASEWFRSVLAAAPNHKAAKIGLGFSEYYGFHQNESAQKFLSAALSSSTRAPRPLESEAWQVQGEIYLAQGKKRDALSSAQTAFKLNPNNENARQLVLRLGGSDKINKGDKSQNNEMIYLGDQYVRQGDCLSAQAEFKAAFDMDPKNATAALKAAKCLWQLNQTYEAIEWLNKAIKSDPKFISAYVLQADYLSQRFDFNSATQSLNNVSRLAANNPEVLRGMALLEFRKNNMIGAINYGLRAVKIYDADIDNYILLSKANLAMAMNIHSSLKKEIERRENAFRDAVRYATKAVELDATSTDAQTAYGHMLAVTSGTDSGVDYLTGLIKKYNYSYEYRIALAEVYKEAERWNDARLIYEQVVEAEPRNKKAWIGLGESLRATGFNEKGLKAFLNAAVIDPTDGEALFQAGKLYFETNRFEEALQQFIRVKAMNPNFPKSNYYAGRAAFALGHFDEALKFALEEKRLNPGLADSYILNAEIHSAQQAFGECASDYAQALKLRPASAEIYVKSAECYRKAGSLEIAETMLTLAMDRESGYAELYREQGALFEKKGDNPAARKSYRNYLELAPNATDRKEIQQRITRLGG